MTKITQRKAPMRVSENRKLRDMGLRGRNGRRMETIT
jgi:hypothetical protein